MAGALRWRAAAKGQGRGATVPSITRTSARGRDVAVDDRGARADAGRAKLGDPLFGGADEPVADHAANRRQQEQEARDVGDEAGHEQQHAARGNQHAVGELGVRRPALRDGLGDRLCRAHALAAGEPHPDHRADQQDEQRPPEPDRGPERDQRDDLDHEVQEDERHTPTTPRGRR